VSRKYRLSDPETERGAGPEYRVRGVDQQGTLTELRPGVPAAVTTCGSGKESGSGRPGKAGQPRGGRDGDRRKSGPEQRVHTERDTGGRSVGSHNIIGAPCTPA